MYYNISIWTFLKGTSALTERFGMRVITGEARGKRLCALSGEDITRPTTDMVKEAIFSIIQFEVAGANVLDLFAGSGQLGIEAVSRGAKGCVFVDSSREAVEIVRKNISACGFQDRCKVMSGDAFSFVKTAAESFDIALLDPPYHHGTLEKVLPLLEKHINEGGMVVCEHEKGLQLEEEYGSLKKYRTYKYGKIALTVYKTEASDGGESE